MKSPFVSGLAVLEHELAQERATSLGRSGRRLETALAALRAHDETMQRDPGPVTAQGRNARRELLLEAGEALWYFIVQRELTGLCDSADVMRDYQVPKAVQACMGLRPPRSPSATEIAPSPLTAPSI